ncbi:hypothetical protein F5X68DRAFT_276477 [Plectosphaerella plurivora]|uniref:Uncharacterized protein n=1 Tax=Plectosphaerella plurivora TaxID=936078 RepID=A0A9P8VB27_9PEZI|nr:hypothetical protein F5X68DRAFT_276477 [Plectosphaerella plurivora]
MRPVTSLRQHAGRLRVASASSCWQCRLASSSRKIAWEDVKKHLEAKVTSSLGGDEHGNALALDTTSKKIHTPAGDLPISPVMDPDWIEARQRFKTPKPKPTTSPSSMGRFRKKLAQNPFAQALATEWRMDGASRLGLPRYFLQDFKVVAHPETKRPWWTPGDLDAIPEHDNIPEDETSEAYGAPQRLKSQHSPVGYISAHKGLIHSLGASRSKNRLGGQHIAMIVSRVRFTRNGIIPKLVWRPDMDEFVLDEMRRRIVDDLLHLARLDREHLMPCPGWEEINKDVSQRGCVLWRAAAGGDPPGPLAVLDIEGASFERSVPVHNLDALLGPDHLKRLIEGADMFSDNALVLVRKKMSLRVQMRLWKLQGYLADSPTERATEKEEEEI